MKMKSIGSIMLADLELLLRIKIHECRIQGLKNISRDDIVSYLLQMCWRKKDSIATCELVEDVLSVEPSLVFEFLSMKAIKESVNLNIEDFQMMFNK